MDSDSHDTLIDPFSISQAFRKDRVRPTLTVLAGPDLGRVFSLIPGKSIIGRGVETSVHIPHESISRRHCEIEVSQEGAAFLRDLSSTNGTRVQERDIVDQTVQLEGGEQIRLSKKVALKFAFQDHLELTAQEDLYSNAVRDALTGVHNKRFFMERIEHEVAYAARHGTPLSLLLFDLDHFKQVNDTYGHAVGDQVLITVAQRVHNTLRSEDIFARFGGEEFIVLMRGTPQSEALNVAERIREAIAAKEITSDDVSLTASVSIGMAMHDIQHTPNAAALIALADTRLYTAKALGRNQVVSS